MKVQVKEANGIVWIGTKLWEEKGFGTEVWQVIRPDDLGIHVQRGSGTREWDENLIRVPNFLNCIKVTPL